jgi:hypothetical protein
MVELLIIRLELPTSLADDGWQLCAGLQDREIRNPADPKVSRTKPPLSGHEQVSFGRAMRLISDGLADPITDEQ